MISSRYRTGNHCSRHCSSGPTIRLAGRAPGNSGLVRVRGLRATRPQATTACGLPEEGVDRCGGVDSRGVEDRQADDGRRQQRVLIDQGRVRSAKDDAVDVVMVLEVIDDGQRGPRRRLNDALDEFVDVRVVQPAR